MNDELTKEQIADMLMLAPWQGRNPEVMYTEKFKAEHPDYMNIEPPPLYFVTGEPFLDLIDDEHMKHHILKEKDGKYCWHRNTALDGVLV